MMSESLTDPTPRSVAGLPPEGSVRIAAILSAPAVLAELGMEPGKVIAEAGLDPALFDDAENSLPFDAVGRFLELCVARTARPDFGLLLGATMHPQMLGLIGALGAAAPDVGTAAREILRYFHLHDRGSVAAMQVKGRQVILSYRFTEPDVAAIGQIYDAAIMYAQAVMRSLAGPHWTPTEVHLSRPRPDNVEVYRRHLGDRISFDADQDANLFPAWWLARPVVGADAPTHRALERLVAALDQRTSADLVARLRHTLRALLDSDLDEQALALARVAEALALHPRTLNRRLRARGTSFKALLDEARYDIARQLLRDTGLSALHIAGRLGYGDATAFARAFRRWSGTTPVAWRSAHRRV